MGSLAQSQQRYQNQQGRINQNEARRFDQVNQYNTQLNNQALQGNLGLANQYDDLDAQNRAMKQKMLAKGIGQQGELGAYDRQEKFMRDREERLYDTDMKRLNIEAWKYGLEGEDLNRIMGDNSYGPGTGKRRK
jgi:hypothetical protein